MDFWGETSIDFIGKRRIAYTFSVIAAIIGLIAVIAIPLGKANLGTDFAGGIAIQFRFDKPVHIEGVRALLEKSGFKDASLQEFAEPNKLLVRLKRTDADLRAVSKSIGEIFAKGMSDNKYSVESTTEVGPTVGKKLQHDALLAVGISLLGILVYVAWRFEFRFGVAAVIATFHDVLAVMGLLYVLDKEMSLLIVTALLTLAGYSLTDTVVVFDRIRENMRGRAKEDTTTLINRSVNEVLRRTIVTSLTTLLAIFALLIMGGEVLYDFSLVLFSGVIVGTYSSIFIASPVLLFWEKKKTVSPAKA
jgi:preprotein translocase subunit SecF